MLNSSWSYLKRISCVLTLFTFVCINNLSQAQAQKSSVNIPYSPYHTPAYTNYYYEEVLKLAFAKTEHEFGKLQINFYPFVAGRERQRAILKNNAGLDVIWSSTNHLREEQLLAIKFNLLQDLSDYKILLIRKEDKEKFAKVKTLEDLRQFKAGTGSHWQDTHILQTNAMPLVTSWDYEPMFKMLAAKRFDYIIRGTQEIWSDVAQHKDLPIMVEETLLIHYELPVYFFVNINNVQLAERIKTGLERAEKDGSLQKLFLSLPDFQQGYNEIHKKRHMLTMRSAN